MMTMRWTRVLACAAVILLPLISRADAAQFFTAKLPSPGFVFAISSEAKTVAIGYPEQKVVRLYPKLLSEGSLDGAKELAVNGLPIGLAHRVVGDRAVYILLTTDDRAIHLLDDKTFDEVGKIALGDGLPLGLAVPSDEKVPYAFYICRPPSSEGAIGRVNLVTKADEGLMETEDIGEIEVSADGRIVYGRKPSVSPSGFRAWRISDPSNPGDSPRADIIASIHDSSGSYVADPFNGMVASGKQLRSTDLTKVITELAHPVRAFMRTKPFILTATEDGVQVFSYNTFQAVGSITFADDAQQPQAPQEPQQPIVEKQGNKTIKRTPLPRPPVQRSSRSSSEARGLRVGQQSLLYPTFIDVDEKHGVLVFAREDKFAVAPLKSLKLPDEPILNVVIDGSTDGEIGQPMKLKIGKLDSNIDISLSNAPQGLKLEGDSIIWTPTPEQIGSHRVALQCKSAAVQRVQEVTLIVRRPSVALSFSPEQIVVSQDGKRALAVSASPDQRPRRRIRNGTPRGGGQGESRVALIDIDKHKLIAERVVPYSVGQAIAIGSDGAYLSSQGANAIYALSLKDLSDTRRVFTNSQLQRLAIVGDVLVSYGYNQNNESGPARFRLPNLEPVGDQQPKRSRWPNQDWGSPEVVGDGWFMQGVVRDAEGKARLLVRPDGIVEMSSNPNQSRRFNGREDFRQGGALPVSTWGVGMMGENLSRLTGQNLGQVPGLDRVILNDLPVLASLTREEVQSDQQSGLRPTQRVSLELHDLISSQTRQTIPLFAEPMPMYEERAIYKLFATPGRIVAMAGPRVFTISTKEIDAKQFHEPVHFEASQDVFVLPADRPITVKCKATGGKSPLTFEIANDMPGLKVDSKTGDMTIDPAPFLARAGDFIQQVMNNNSGMRSGQSTSKPSEIVQAFAADAQAQFKELTGQDAKGYPLAIPADVSVRDDEQQTAVLNRVLLLDVPMEAIAGRMEQQLDQQRRQQEQYRQQRDAMRQQQPERAATTTKPSADEVESLRRRLSELEKKNTELEAQNKLLKELLGQSKEDKPKR